MATVITSIIGLQNLSNLREFYADWNSLKTVNLSGLTDLTIVDISDNETLDGSSKSLTSVNLSGCTALQTLRLDGSDFSAGIPNIKGRVNLESLDMDQSSITGSVDLSTLSSLTFLDLNGNTDITSVKLPESSLDFVDISDTALTEAAVNDILQWLDGSGVMNGNVELDGGTSAIPTGDGIIAKDNLITKGWSVNTNVPPVDLRFISTWRTTDPDETLALPYMPAGTYSGTIDWGDGTTSANSYATCIHTYATPGDHVIIVDGVTIGFSSALSPYVSGAFPPPLYFDSPAKLISVNQWGNLKAGDGTSNGFGAFAFCFNLDLSTVTDVIDLTGVTSMEQFFAGTSALTTVNRMNEWDVSSVTSMRYMFNSSTFNQDISSWNVSSVTDMSSIFSSANYFNQNIGLWNVSNVTDMTYMFANANAFNQNIGAWNVSSVTNMGDMFGGTSAFNQDISGWNVSGVTTMSGMFYNATAFNKNLSTWCVSLIPSEPFLFATGATAWVLPKPIWGTCP